MIPKKRLHRCIWYFSLLKSLTFQLLLLKFLQWVLNATFRGIHLSLRLASLLICGSHPVQNSFYHTASPVVSSTVTLSFVSAITSWIHNYFIAWRRLAVGSRNVAIYISSDYILRQTIIHFIIITLTMLWRNSWPPTGQTHEKLTSICLCYDWLWEKNEIVPHWVPNNRDLQQVNLTWARGPIENQHLVSGQLEKTSNLDEL